MKNLKTALLLTTLTALFGMTGMGKVKADDHYGPYHPYTYGHDGYWDEHRGYHHWENYNGHQGYWHRRDDGVRVFINL